MATSVLFRIDHLQVKGKICPPISLGANEIISISGPSGCGKTRLLRAIADMDLNDGCIFLASKARETIPAPKWRTEVMLFPSDAVWWHDHVAEHFSSVPDPHWLNMLGLQAEAMNWEVSRLSSGERQRLGLLRALVKKPKVLLLDEPTANLDETNVQRVESFLLDYLQTQQAGALWVSHDPEQLARISKQNLKYDDGWKLS